MNSALKPVGFWKAESGLPAFEGARLREAIAAVRQPLHVVLDADARRLGVALSGGVGFEPKRNGTPSFPLLATLPAMYPEWLGDRAFTEVHGVRFPYIAGEMANGLATVQMVVAMAQARMLGFFGAAGLALSEVARAIDEIEAALAGTNAPWGSNLIHSPADPALENALADLYIKRGVTRVSASAFMGMTPAVVRYAASGLAVDARGHIQRRHHVFAKVSRPEVATHFMSPAPTPTLQALVRDGLLSEAEAKLAARVPVAEDVTVEADSGGHTDNRPLAALFPIILRLKDDLSSRFGYARPIRVGAAGGIGTPSAVASAFSLGAAYVMTGSINQSAIESGLSAEGKALLARAGLADVMMAPAADMFEMGVKVQVLRQGTMFAMRAQRLFDLYAAHPSLEAIPEPVRVKLEKEVLGLSCGEIYRQVCDFFASRDPATLARAERDGKHRMALVFRWYLGLSSKWAIRGEPSRRLDYQIWCGPAMGAFNEWVKGSFLEPLANRHVVQIALNLLEGAAVVSRAQQVRCYGVAAPSNLFSYVPRPLQ